MHASLNLFRLEISNVLVSNCHPAGGTRKEIHEKDHSFNEKDHSFKRVRTCGLQDKVLLWVFDAVGFNRVCDRLGNGPNRKESQLYGRHLSR